MKAFLALALFQIVALVNCGVYKTTDLGEKGEKDILIYNERVNIYKTVLDPFAYVSFPPKGLIKNYNVNYVKVRDYNKAPADAFIYDGHIGGHEITIALKAPLLKRIEATVEIYGTFNGPCANTDDKPQDKNTTKKPETKEENKGKEEKEVKEEKEDQPIFTN